LQSFQQHLRSGLENVLCEGEDTMAEFMRESVCLPWIGGWGGGNDRRAALKHKLTLGVISAMLGALLSGCTQALDGSMKRRLAPQKGGRPPKIGLDARQSELPFRPE
jgi:hypothetical protein